MLEENYTRDYIAEQIYIRCMSESYGPFDKALADQVARESFLAAAAFIEVKRTVRPEAKKNDDDCNGY